MTTQATPISFRVDFARTRDAQDENTLHAIIFIPGSPKSLRRTVCGIPQPDTLPAAPFRVNDTRNPFMSEVGCPVCQDGITI